MRTRTALLLTAAVPLTATAAAMTLKAGHWRMTYSVRGIWLDPRPRPNCRDCQGAGGRWTGEPYREMEACECWADRRELVLQLLTRPTVADEGPPF